MNSYNQIFVPSQDVVTTIVIPTIIFCIIMVIAMLIGINKCKQWELDKIVEMRRTRRVIQRITARLREKNFNTIERARTLRRRAKYESKQVNSDMPSAPPLYQLGNQNVGSSPPPTYEDALLEQYYQECIPPKVEKYSF